MTNCILDALQSLPLGCQCGLCDHPEHQPPMVGGVGTRFVFEEAPVPWELLSPRCQVGLCRHPRHEADARARGFIG